jgi:hypothetical protein
MRVSLSESSHGIQFLPAAGGLNSSHHNGFLGWHCHSPRKELNVTENSNTEAG